MQKNLDSTDKKEIWQAIDRLRESITGLNEHLSAQITRVTENFNTQISELNKFIYQNIKKDSNGHAILNQNNFDWRAVAVVVTGVGLIISVIFQVNNSTNMQIRFLSEVTNQRAEFLDREMRLRTELNSKIIEDLKKEIKVLEGKN